MQKLVARAAEEETLDAEAAAEQQALAEEFDFNFSDAKKGNQWQPSDVEAALAYYEGEKFLQGSTEMPYEAEFVTNPLSAYPGGPEDSSWLQDVDNNEAYETDDYALAGIPEAAPKVKRNQREEEEDNDEELKALEEEKITAAAFDDVEGLADEEDDNPEAAWNWRFEGDAVEEQVVVAGGKRVADDEAFINSLSLDLGTQDDLALEDKELLTLAWDAAGGNMDDANIDLDLVEAPFEEVELSANDLLSAEERAAIEAVLSEEVDTSAVLSAASSVPDFTSELSSAAADEAARGPPVSQEAVQEYINALRAVDVKAVGGVDDATVSKLLSTGEAEKVAPADTSVLGDAPARPAVPAALTEEDPVFEKFLDSADPNEAAAAEAIALLNNIEELAAEVDEYNEAAFPQDAILQEMEELIDVALEYYDAAGDEAIGMIEERPENAPVDMFADMDPDLVAGADAYGAEEEDFSDRGGQFVERILELGRVTKVVKGGKIMGFRCVAVVGDGKGRVGVGCQAGREVGTAVKRALVDAKKNIVEVPLVGAGTIPHRTEAWFKAAGVVIQPAAEGTGVIAGGAVRSVLELAGVQNVLAKRLGSRSCLNNARVTLKALSELRTMDDYAAARGIPLGYMLS